MTNNNSDYGTGLVLLTTAFLVLKVLGYIDWKWVWIFAPLWIPLSIVLIILLIIFIVAWKD